MVGNDGKERRFDDALAANRRRILAIARAYAPVNEIRDLCQEILLQMWKGFDSFEGRSAPSTWVYRVALNTAITYRRRNGRSIERACRPLTETTPDPVAPASSEDHILIVEEFLRSLSKVDRAVFLLYLEDLTYRDISEITGLTENHVGVRICRLKKTFMKRYCEGDYGIR